MEISELKLYDRSRVVTDWGCGRRRYLQYEYDGKGLVPDSQGLELFLGTTLHDGLSGIARGIDIDKICSVAHTLVGDVLSQSIKGGEADGTFVLEQQCLIEGLLRGFNKVVWPRLISQYPIIQFIEEEMEYAHNGLMFMSKPDLVVADAEGNSYYIEYKSTSSKKEEWINSWNTAIQLHSTCKAIEATKGIKISATIVQGLYKGFVSYGKQGSPFCYGYGRSPNPPFTTGQISYEYKAGLKKFPVWEVDGGVKAWVDGMPESILIDQFPQTPPIFIKDDLVDSFFKQRDYREHEIELANQMMAQSDEEGRQNILDLTYPQKFDQCYPGWGRKCDFIRICHSGMGDPLENGFSYRTPHHELETQQWKAKQDEADGITPPDVDDTWVCSSDAAT